MTNDYSLTTVAGQAFRSYVNEQLGLVDRHLSELIEQAGQQTDGHLSAKSVHDLRVASRRCQSAALAFAPYVPAIWSRQVKTGVRPLRRSFNKLRDLDVLMEWLTSDPIAHLASAGLLDVLKKLRQRESEKQARSMLKRDDKNDLARLTDQLSEEDEASRSGPVYMLEDVILTILLARASEVTAFRFAMSETGRITWEQDLHRLRIAAKNFRYTLDIMTLAQPFDLSSLHSRFCQLQDSLGGLHDCLRFSRILESVFRKNRLPADLLLEIQFELGKRKHTLWDAFQADWIVMTPGWFADHVMRAFIARGGTRE